MIQSEQKAKENNIDINKCYEKVDFLKKISKGVYQGNKKDFNIFMTAQ